MENQSYPVLFGDWLKARRKALDLTQDELAVRAGCSIFALRKIESGERRPSKQLAGLLACALELPEEDKQSFIRVARGELNLERLHAPTLDVPSASLPDDKPAPAIKRLPLQPTPLLGRETELAAMTRLFNEPHSRLLTLTGPGGIGKTRLAIEFASRQHLSFPDGIYYVSLASINAPDLIIPAVAESLGFNFTGPTDLKEQLILYITNRLKQPLLLVLDNLEHLLSEASGDEKSVGTADLVSEMLQRLPIVKILATSRERLNLQGEWTYELHGLPVPPVDFDGNLEDYSAAALFIQGARRAKVDYEVAEGERAAVIKICQLLDGIPLGIELAAAWTGTLSCAVLAKEIEANIDFLTTSIRDVPERHRSLRATFDHSWKLLSAQEQDVLSRLSVFRGGFDRIAAEKVAGATLLHLASLVSKSLVRRVDNERYDLHEVIRQYALSCLDGEQARCLETCDHHSEYYLVLASGLEKKLKSSSQQSAAREMTAEMDNMRTAWEWGIKRRKYEPIGRAVRSFGWFYEVSGMLHDGIDQLELLVQALRDQTRDIQMNKALGTALVHQGLLYFRTGQFAKAQELYSDSIAILRSVNAQALLADALIFSGTLMHLNGEYLEAERLIKEGLECALATDNQWFVAYGIYNLGHVASLMGEYQKGYEQMQEGLKIWRDVGDPHSISLGLNFLVDTQIALERYEEAKVSMQESIALCKQTKNRWGMGTAYRYLGLATLAGGQYDEALDYFHKSLEIFGEYFEGWDIARTLSYLGDAIAMKGDLFEARKIYMDALRTAVEVGSIPIALDASFGLACLMKGAGKIEQALEISIYVANHAASIQETKDRANRLFSELAGKFRPDQVKAMSAGMKSMSLDMVVSDLLYSDVGTEDGEALV